MSDNIPELPELTPEEAATMIIKKLSKQELIQLAFTLDEDYGAREFYEVVQAACRQAAPEYFEDDETDDEAAPDSDEL